MNHTVADDPNNIRVVRALRSTGARIYDARDGFFCEVRSTLRAMGVSRKAGLRRILNSPATIYQRLFLPEGPSVFVTNADINALLDHFYGAPEQQRRVARSLHQKHGKNCLYLRWPHIAIVCGGYSTHPAVMAWICWYVTDFIPTIHAYGYYDPTTNHEPPPTGLLDAIERREWVHDVFRRQFQRNEDIVPRQWDEEGLDAMPDWDDGDSRDW